MSHLPFEPQKGSPEHQHAPKKAKGRAYRHMRYLWCILGGHSSAARWVARRWQSRPVKKLRAVVARFVRRVWGPLRPLQRQGYQQACLYLGLWVSADGYIRQMLQADGRFTEQRGSHVIAYQGEYRIHHDPVQRLDRIDFRDDSGEVSHGRFIEGVLHHAGVILYPEPALANAHYRKRA